MQFAQFKLEHTAQLRVMQPAYAVGMSISSTRHLRRQANLERLIEEVGGPTQLALLAETPKTHISALRRGSRGIGDGLAAKLEQACDKPPGWMDLEPVLAYPLASGDSPPPSLGESVTNYRGVALDLSQSRPIVATPKLEWEQLMRGGLPERFDLVLRDDALGEQGKKGEIGKFSTIAKPIEGRGVLFADRDGNHYVRIYQVRTIGRWAAVSANPQAYGTLDSEADGLQLLAVMVGLQWA